MPSILNHKWTSKMFLKKFLRCVLKKNEMQCLLFLISVRNDILQIAFIPSLNFFKFELIFVLVQGMDWSGVFLFICFYFGGFFCIWTSSCSTTNCWKHCLHSTEFWKGKASLHLVKSHLTTYVWIDSWTVYCASIIFLSILLLISHCLGDCKFIISLIMLALQFSLFQNSFGIPRSFHFHISFRNSLSISTKKILLCFHLELCWMYRYSKGEIKSPDPWTWCIFLFIWVFFNFYQHCSVFSYTYLTHFLSYLVLNISHLLMLL